VAGAQFRFDRRDLLAATVDSCRLLPAGVGDFLERSPITIGRGLVPAQRLPALHDHVNVLGIQFDAAAHPPVTSAAARVVPLPRKGS